LSHLIVYTHVDTAIKGVTRPLLDLTVPALPSASFTTHVRVCVHVNARAAKFLIHMRAGADAQRAGLVRAFDDDVLYLFFQTQN
jgi:hypothetical protein